MRRIAHIIDPECDLQTLRIEIHFSRLGGEETGRKREERNATQIRWRSDWVIFEYGSRGRTEILCICHRKDGRINIEGRFAQRSLNPSTTTTTNRDQKGELPLTSTPNPESNPPIFVLTAFLEAFRGYITQHSALSAERAHSCRFRCS